MWTNRLYIRVILRKAPLETYRMDGDGGTSHDLRCDLYSCDRSDGLCSMLELSRAVRPTLGKSHERLTDCVGTCVRSTTLGTTLIACDAAATGTVVFVTAVPTREGTDPFCILGGNGATT